jgi:hypothetical protein
MPLKWLVLAGVTFIVLFPHLSQFTRHLARVRNLQAMIEGSAPELAPWEEEIRRRMEQLATSGPAASGPVADSPQALSPAVVQRLIERLVFEKVAYAFDWDTWGNLDYIPTVGEMFAEAERYRPCRIWEDCDGRAVMAASLMRRMGYQPSLVTDLGHVWVVTPEGEWMGPGGARTLVSTPEGNRIDFAAAWRNLPRAPAALSFGLAIFPLPRELLILLTAYLLMLHRRMSWRWAAVGAILLLQGLLFMRGAVLSSSVPLRFDSSWPAFIGLPHVLAGLIVLLLASRKARRATAVTPPRGPCSDQPAD